MSEGRALRHVVGLSAGAVIITKLIGERDDARFQAALTNPTLVCDAIRQVTADLVPVTAPEAGRRPRPGSQNREVVVHFAGGRTSDRRRLTAPAGRRRQTEALRTAWRK